MHQSGCLHGSERKNLSLPDQTASMPRVRPVSHITLIGEKEMGSRTETSDPDQIEVKAKGWAIELEKARDFVAACSPQPK